MEMEGEIGFDDFTFNQWTQDTRKKCWASNWQMLPINYHKILNTTY